MKEYITNEKGKFTPLLAIVILASLINWKAGIGVVLGFLISNLHFAIIKYRYRNLEMKTKIQKILMILGALFGTFFLACPLLFAFMYPEFINWIGVLIGLMFEKFRFFITAILQNQDKGVS